jgi:hypothetical protein
LPGLANCLRTTFMSLTRPLRAAHDGECAEKSSRSTDRMLITKATFTVPPRTSRGTKSRAIRPIRRLAQGRGVATPRLTAWHESEVVSGRHGDSALHHWPLQAPNIDLAAPEVGLIVDVRTNPQYDRETLPGSLSGLQIAYEHVAELGGRRAQEIGRAVSVGPTAALGCARRRATPFVKGDDDGGVGRAGPDR